MKIKTTIKQITKREFLARLLGQALGRLQADPSDFLSREAVPHYRGLLENLSPDNADMVSVSEEEES